MSVKFTSFHPLGATVYTVYRGRVEAATVRSVYLALNSVDNPQIEYNVRIERGDNYLNVMHEDLASTREQLLAQLNAP